LGIDRIIAREIRRQAYEKAQDLEGARNILEELQEVDVSTMGADDLLDHQDELEHAEEEVERLEGEIESMEDEADIQETYDTLGPEI